jgi:hypothetical protein
VLAGFARSHLAFVLEERKNSQNLHSLPEEEIMKRSLIAILLICSASAAYADDSCKSRAADKKLAGAALASFSKKCASDAQTSCTQQAADKKLNGAAKTSFTKKCVNDAVGS